MALDFNSQSDRDVQQLVEDLENVIQSPITDTDMGIKQENRLKNRQNNRESKKYLKTKK